jgi:hypothetical protein
METKPNLFKSRWLVGLSCDDQNCNHQHNNNKHTRSESNSSESTIAELDTTSGAATGAPVVALSAFTRAIAMRAQPSTRSCCTIYAIKVPYTACKIASLRGALADCRVVEQLGVATLLDINKCIIVGVDRVVSLKAQAESVTLESISSQTVKTNGLFPTTHLRYQGMWHA